MSLGARASHFLLRQAYCKKIIALSGVTSRGGAMAIWDFGLKSQNVGKGGEILGGVHHRWAKNGQKGGILPGVFQFFWPRIIQMLKKWRSTREQEVF